MWLWTISFGKKTEKKRLESSQIVDGSTFLFDGLWHFLVLVFLSSLFWQMNVNNYFVLFYLKWFHNHTFKKFFEWFHYLYEIQILVVIFINIGNMLQWELYFSLSLIFFTCLVVMEVSLKWLLQNYWNCLLWFEMKTSLSIKIKSVFCIGRMRVN